MYTVYLYCVRGFSARCCLSLNETTSCIIYICMDRLCTTIYHYNIILYNTIYYYLYHTNTTQQHNNTTTQQSYHHTNITQYNNTIQQYSNHVIVVINSNHSEHISAVIIWRIYNNLRRNITNTQHLYHLEDMSIIYLSQALSSIYIWYVLSCSGVQDRRRIQIARCNCSGIHHNIKTAISAVLHSRRKTEHDRFRI